MQIGTLQIQGEVNIVKEHGISLFNQPLLVLLLLFVGKPIPTGKNGKSEATL